MPRDPRTDPRAGDVLLLHAFGPAGTRFHVKRVGEGRLGGGAKSPQPIVHCRLYSVDGSHVENRGRTYNLSTWPAFMRTAEVVKLAEEASHVE